MIGRTLDHYRIEGKLGEGGMGVVYSALDTQLDRRVAIKVLPADKVADPARKQRFVQEARAASALNHPGIVTIHDIRSEDGVDFIVMEHIEGKTLEELIPDKGMRPAQALKHAVEIADALAKAHAARILHRDLKPSNVMVTDEGRVKILDFGLAKLLEPGESSPDGSTLAAFTLTGEGAVVGTVAYMSPEQAEGRTLDERSDIFSFGSMLYEMTTGRKPFTGRSTLSTLTQILSQDPATPSQLGASLPPELERIILRCLRKDPARRYQTVADLKVALEDVTQERTAGKQVRRPSRQGWLVGLAAALLGAGLLVWQRSRAPEPVEPTRAIPLSTEPGVARYPSFSPDGNHVAFSWTGQKQDNPDVYVQQIGSAGSPLRRTTDPSSDSAPVWSPDGRWIAFLRSREEAGRSELLLIPPLAGRERKVAEIRVRGGTWVSPPYHAWCPDSACLVVTDSPGEGQPDALFVLSLETGEKRQLTHPRPPVQGDTNPAVSPDGKWLVFRRQGSLFAGELFRLALGSGPSAGGEPHRLTPATLDAGHPAWMPDSREILFSAQGSLWRLAVAGAGSPARLPFVGEDGLMPAISRPQADRPSRLVYVRSLDDFNLWRVETPAPGAAAPSPPVVSIASTRGDYMAQISPDGRRVAFASNRSGGGSIWLADLDGSNAVEIAAMGAFATGYPHWSPDGERIVFHSNREGQPEVYVVPAAGGKPRNLTAHPANDYFPSFSRDGRWIYFNSNREVDGQIWKIPASGGDAVQVTEDAAYAPSESPDGAELYSVETLDRPSPLWRRPVSGGAPVKVLDGVVLANFVVLAGGVYYIDQPSGQGGIYFLDKPSGETRLRYFDFASRRSTTVAGNLGTVDLPLTASADGRIVLFSRMDSSFDDLMLVENFR